MTFLKYSLFFVTIIFCCFIEFSIEQEKNECKNSNETVTLYSDYLECLSTNQNMHAVEMDKELVDEAKRTIETCFADKVTDAKKDKKCFFDHDLLQTKGLAWSSRGPLKNCPLCLHFAKISIDAIIGADQSVARCVRKIIYPAIGREGGECLKNNITDFSDKEIPDIPDFEVESMKNPDEALESISIEILRNFRLNKCRERNPGWAENTEKCLMNPKLENFMPKHCKAVESCKNETSESCSKKLDEIEKPTCGCFKITGEEIKKKLETVGDDLKKLYSSRPGNQKLGAATRPEIEKCVETIRNEAKTPANDWFELINESLQKCGKNGMQFKPLLQLFCGAVIREIGVTVTEALDTSFQFLSALIDAVIHRIARYCTEQC
jgi:hypothetical protein